jgi:hypothetical protein
MGFLQEGKEVCARYHIDYFSFGGFFDLYACFFDSCIK